jgi:hypothetical protein
MSRARAHILHPITVTYDSQLASYSNDRYMSAAACFLAAAAAAAVSRSAAAAREEA